MRHVSRLVVFALGLALLPHVAASQSGAASQDSLKILAKRAFATRDTAAARALVYWPSDVTAEQRVRFDRVLSYAFGQGTPGAVDIVPVPKDEVLEYTRDGVVYRPTLPPIGQLSITYGAPTSGTSVKILVGQLSGRYYFTTATATKKPTPPFE